MWKEQILSLLKLNYSNRHKLMDLLLLLLILEVVCLIIPVVLVLTTWNIYFIIITSIKILKFTFRPFVISVFGCNINKNSTLGQQKKFNPQISLAACCKLLLSPQNNFAKRAQRWRLHYIYDR
jgi:hypothetical protein